MREGNNGERQQRLIERTRKTDKQITGEKSKIYYKPRRKEKTVEEVKGKRRQKEIDIREEENT